jgi:hypothetical protein
VSRGAIPVFHLIEHLIERTRKDLDLSMLTHVNSR